MLDPQSTVCITSVSALYRAQALHTLLALAWLGYVCSTLRFHMHARAQAKMRNVSDGHSIAH